MLRSLILVSAISTLSACATPSFYSNETLNAESALRTVNAVVVDTKNKEFKVFKIDSGTYAILPAHKQYQTELDELNASLILTPDQVKELIGACAKISAAYEKDSNGQTTVIDYRIKLRDPELVGIGSTYAYGNSLGMGINTKTQVVERQRVVFRLQYAQSKGIGLGAGKNIKYLLGDYSSDLAIEDVRALIADLAK